MYQVFDAALTQALKSEYPLFGASDRSIAAAAARRASAENRVKAMNEATLGNVGFASIHDTASARYHTDAELVASGKPPVNHPISFYLSMAATEGKSEGASAKAARQPLIQKAA